MKKTFYSQCQMSNIGLHCAPTPCKKEGELSERGDIRTNMSKCPDPRARVRGGAVRRPSQAGIKLAPSEDEIKTRSIARFLPRDASIERGLCRHVVYVCPSVTFVHSVKTKFLTVQ